MKAKYTEFMTQNKKVVICYPLYHNLEMWKFLVILVVIKLYARIDIIKLVVTHHSLFKTFGTVIDKHL